MAELSKLKIRKNKKVLKVDGFEYIVEYRVRIHSLEKAIYEIEVESIIRYENTVEPMSKEGVRIFKELNSVVKQDVSSFLRELNDK